MLQNHFKIAWRNLTRNRSHAFINLLGLAIGITCCLLILLWVADEWSYDKWNEKADRIYRVATEINFGGSHKHYAVAPAPLSQALINDFPEVETATRIRTLGASLVKRDVLNFNETAIIYTDSTFFDVFSVKLLEGNKREVLALPNTVVISERIAKKYFPSHNPIGEVLTFDNKREYTVVGVAENLPANTHFNADFYVSLQGVRGADDGIWVSHNFHTYYVLREGTDVRAFEAKVFPHILEKYIDPQVQVIMGKGYKEFAASGAFIKYHYQPLTDIHLKSDLATELGANGNMQYVWIFLAAALFILLIACVNFMNLSTARASVRAKEIGVRKVLGSMRSHLIRQFLVESMLMAGMALLLGIMLAQLTLPYYNILADKQLYIPSDNLLFWGISLLGVAVVGLLAGSYPAFYLSGFKPIKVLSGKLFEKGGNLSLRNGLVVFQFIIAVLLIIGTLVINSQLQFIQHKKLGFEREQILILDNVESLNEKAFILKSELLNHPKISSATVSGYLPIPSSRSDSPLCRDRVIREDNCVSIQFWDVDEDYIPTFEIEMLAGRNFSPDMPTDSNAVIINETAAKLFGFENPIGQKIYGSISFDPQGGQILPVSTIIGVIKDFHFESLRQNIGALSLWLNPYPGYISMKINTDELPALIADIERTWKAIAPGQPFKYRFMDESFNQVYSSETRVSRIFIIFAGLSIFIACLGLFGLAAFATEQRTKEIGIRKVLGASTTNLIALLSKEFMKLVIIALFIAIPVAWYFMNQWLEDFAYRINMDWWIFVIAGITAILIAFITVSFQSIKAALRNPIKALRSE